MNLLGILKLNEDALEWLALDLFRRAAEFYEQAEMLSDASECWQAAGQPGRAAELYLRRGDYTRAAPLLLAQGRYEEALANYRAWLAKALRGDTVAQVTSRLGIAACLMLMKAKPEEAREEYRAARSLVEDDGERSNFIAARCWEALGAYGATVGRGDLVQLAYERALAAYGAQPGAERTRAAEAYVAAARDNRLLAGEIEARIAEWRLAPVFGVTTIPNLDIVGQRFGDWALWRMKGKKLLLLTRARDQVAIEVWTDSVGWFKWSQRRTQRMFYSDGATGSGTREVNFDAYFSRETDLSLMPGSPEVLGSAEIDNYRWSWSGYSLQLINKVRGVTIILHPDTSYFQFVDTEGLTHIFPHSIQPS